MNTIRNSVRLSAFALLGAAALLVPGAAGAGASASVAVRYFVPANCRVTSNDAIAVDAGAAGSVGEYCNSGGYSIVAHYRPLAADEAVTLVYNGQSVILPAGGEAVLRVSGMADVKSSAYAVSAAKVDQPLLLRLSAMPQSGPHI